MTERPTHTKDLGSRPTRLDVSAGNTQCGVVKCTSSPAPGQYFPPQPMRLEVAEGNTQCGVVKCTSSPAPGQYFPPRQMPVAAA